MIIKRINNRDFESSGDWSPSPSADKSNKAPTGEVETALFVAKSDAELSSMYP
jgi:starch-binding outer membrane protein SusE/F